MWKANENTLLHRWWEELSKEYLRDGFTINVTIGNDFRILIENTEQRTAEQLERGMTQAQLADCSEQEVKLISDMVIDLKGSLWRLDLTGSKE